MGLLEAFRESYMASQESFRRHDFEATFANLPEDVVWEPIPDIVDWEPLRGRDAVIESFRELARQWPDWRVELKDITEPEPGLIRVRFRGSGTGSASGARTETAVIQDWDFRHQPLHVREYVDRGD